MSEFHQLARRIGLIGATNLLISLSGLILLPILTKTLPIEEYGTYVQITVTISLVPPIVMLGLPYTMVRFLAGAKTREEIQEGYYSIAGITIMTAGLASVALFIMAEPIANILFDGRTMVTRILALVVFLECMNILQFNYFRTFRQIKRYSSLLFFKTCLQLLLVGGLVLAGYGIFGAVMGLFISDLTLLLMMGFLIVSGIGVAIPTFTHLREYLSFGLPTVPGNVSGWVVNSSDRYMIAIFLGAAYVGYYAPGYALGNIIGIFIAPLSFMLPAVLSGYYDDKNHEAVRTVLTNSMKYYLALAIPSVIGLSLLSKPLLLILSTGEIAEQGYLITPLAAMAALLFGVRAINSQILILEKKTLITGKIWIICGSLNFILNLFFIPVIGIIGAAMTTTITYLVSYLLIGYVSKKYYIIPINRPFICKSLFASFLMAIAIISLNPVGLMEIILSIFIGFIVYVGILLLLKGFSGSEIHFFKSILYGKTSLKKGTDVKDSHKLK